MIDFSDMEQYALRILTEKTDDGLLPSSIAKEYQQQFLEIMIDEYQDSNLIQEAILTSISTVSEGRYNIFMVGDVKPVSYTHLDVYKRQIEIYERGAGYTLASGTGACAAAGVAYKLGMTNNKVVVQMPGGELQVEIEDDWNVFMTGDVFYVAKITLSNEFVEKLRAI